jgi:hypothetical protein
VITAISILVLATIYLAKILHDNKESKKKEILDYAIALVEEGIAYSEEKNKYNKTEAAHNAGLALRKQPVEVTKDPIASTRFFNSAMAPQREICHNNAKNYIIESVNKIKNEEMKEAVRKIFENTVDDAIRLRISAAKMGTLDPIKPLLYRNMV